MPPTTIPAGVAFLPKPFDIDRLAAVVDQMLATRENRG
jgi:DNA-binding NtrC family response regulator